MVIINEAVKVLGVDPGSTRTNPMGWAIIEKDELLDYGCVRVNCTGPERLEKIYNKMEKVIKKHSDIELYCIENQFGPSGQSLKTISEVIGTIRFLLRSYNIKYYDKYHPSHIKKVITGKGNASKEEVMKVIRSVYNIEEELNDDESDAIAIAHTGFHHMETEDKVS